jgi:uncharacterized membrane protein
VGTPAPQAQRGRIVVRLVIAAVVGAIAAFCVGSFAGWRYAPAAGWIFAAIIYLAWTWLTIGRMDHRATRAHATEAGGDSTRRVTEVIVLLASVASLGGVGYLLLAAASGKGSSADIAALVGVLSVATAWAVVHTVYTLRYAKQYFMQPVGGVEFYYDTPTYRDFAYLAFTIGMTYQVSDTDLKDALMRRIALQHAMLSYLLGTVVLAITINLVVNLGNSHP